MKPRKNQRFTSQHPREELEKNKRVSPRPRRVIDLSKMSNANTQNGDRSEKKNKTGKNNNKNYPPVSHFRAAVIP